MLTIACPYILHRSAGELVESQARDELVQQFNESYNAKTGKGWGFFHAESGAPRFSGWLSKYLAGTEDFTEFSGTAIEHLQKLMEESSLTVGGNIFFCHHLQGMTDYPLIKPALLPIGHQEFDGAFGTHLVQVFGDP
ncbi:nucleoid-associated protein [Pseudomonas sp. 10S4]|uniref:nucleoid-associated protein n=1 Tax=Pseudomonas sp. 10S4 TaxID=3048583 RepID=UPI003A0FBB13